MEHGGDIYGNQNIELDYSVSLSPLGTPQSVILQMREEIPLTCYPDLQCRGLRSALSQRLGLPADQILCGNGASELLMAVVQAVRPKRALVPAPTYQGYERALQAAGAEIVTHDLRREEGYILTERILEEARDVSMLFLCNPNNPVGNCIAPALLRRIADHCRDNGIVLVVDECYLDLLPDAERRTMRNALASNPYLVIINAFTKAYAMPGIRLGYLLTANGDLHEKIRLQQPEWSVSMFAQRAGIAALGDRGYLPRAVQEVRTEREFVCEKLRVIGAEVFDGEAPFVMFRTQEELYEPLRARGILIRRCAGFRGMAEVRPEPGSSGHFYRIGLRSRAENEKLMETIGQIVRCGSSTPAL